MRFDWDPAKNRSNVWRHGIDFADAVRIFDGPTVEQIDDRNYGEERWKAFGLMHGIEITVIYTDRLISGDEVRWIISARRAEHDDREAFYRSIGH